MGGGCRGGACPRPCRNVSAETSRTSHLSVALDRPIEVEPPAIPARKPRVSVDRDLLLVEQARKLRQRVLDEGWWRRNRRNLPSLRPEEAELAIRGALDAISLLVNGPMVTAAEQNQVVEARFPSIGPVFQVVSLAVLQATARKLATFVPVRSVHGELPGESCGFGGRRRGCSPRNRVS